MTRTNFEALAVAKGVCHAFYTALRCGITKAQAELWALQVSKKNPQLLQKLFASVQ